jgi:hypothetical protein
MPVDVKAILAAAEPEPVFGEDVMALSRIAQSNRTYRRAQELREEQEYNTLAIAQGAEIAGSVNFMDSLADIDLAIGEVAKMSAAHKDNNLVQASLTKLRGGLEETKELAAGRNLAVEGLSDLSDEVYQMHEDRAKGGIYNEAAVTDLIKSAKNYVNTNAHYLDQNLRKDYESEIDDLVKTRNVYNMIDFYDTEEKEQIQFQTDPSQPDYLTSIQQASLQQAKNYADVGNIPDAVKSISRLAEIGRLQRQSEARTSGINIAKQHLAEYGSSIEAIKTEWAGVQKFLGVGLEKANEPPMPDDLKKAVSKYNVELPTARLLAGEGGLEILNTNIESSSELLSTTLDFASGHGLWNPDALEKISITDIEAKYLALPEGSNLQDVLDAYGRRTVMEEKEPYMDILATYAADAENLQGLAKGFKGRNLVPWIDEKEMNAAKFMSGAARTYIKLKTLRQKHFYDTPVGQLYNFMDVQTQGQGSGFIDFKY